VRFLNNYKLKRSVALLTAVLLFSANVHAANWLQLQGTEPEGAEQLAKVWGFVQVQYQDDSSTPDALDRYIPPKLIGPNLDSQSAFNVNRARIGVRGVAMPLDQKINYFLLLEMGNNGITEPEGSFEGNRCQYHLQSPEGSPVPGGSFQVPGCRRRAAGYSRIRLHQLHVGNAADDARTVCESKLHTE